MFASWTFVSILNKFVVRLLEITGTALFIAIALAGKKLDRFGADALSTRHLSVAFWSKVNLLFLKTA